MLAAQQAAQRQAAGAAGQPNAAQQQQLQQQQQQAQYAQQQQQQQQQYAQQQAPPPPGGGQDEGVGRQQSITVNGCQHPTVGQIVRGAFAIAGDNHGRPFYKKAEQVNGLDVMIYFWDERDGASFSGWWFGPKLGGDQVWAYHPSRVSQSPPKSGWKVPYDGPVDPSFTLAAGDQQQGGWNQQQQGQQYGQQNDQQRQQEEAFKRQQMQNQQQLEEMKRKREEENR